MKHSKRYAVLLVGLALLVFSIGCSKKSPVAFSKASKKTSTILMKATPTHNQNALMSIVPVTGGNLDIQSAMINIDQFKIEENSGFDVEQQSDHNDGDQGGVDNEAGGNDTNGPDAADIVVTGPFALDISNGEMLIDSVAVYPGTFRKVDFTFTINTAPPFNGKAILLSGVFTPNTGAAIPFTLKSEFNKTIQSKIAGNGITVTNNATVPVKVIFDLASWFNTLDFSGAQLSNGEIIIDSTNNAALLTAFEANLAKYVEVEKESDNS